MTAGTALPINGKPDDVPQTEAPGVMGPVEVCRTAGEPAAAQGEGNWAKAPVASRNGPSKSTLFQMAFSQNKPIPPRIEVLPFFIGSQAKPRFGPKFLLGWFTGLPSPGS